MEIRTGCAGGGESERPFNEMGGGERSGTAEVAADAAADAPLLFFLCKLGTLTVILASLASE